MDYCRTPTCIACTDTLAIGAGDCLYAEGVLSYSLTLHDKNKHHEKSSHSKMKSVEMLCGEFQ